MRVHSITRQSPINYNSLMLPSKLYNNKQYSTFKVKIFNSAKNINRAQDPLDMKSYGQLKKSRKRKMTGSNGYVDLSLRGGHVPEIRKPIVQVISQNTPVPSKKIQINQKRQYSHVQNSEINKQKIQTETEAEKMIKSSKFVTTQFSKQLDTTVSKKINKINIIRKLQTPKRTQSDNQCGNKYGIRFHKRQKTNLQVQKKIMKNRPLFYLDSLFLNKIKAQSFIITQYPSGQIITGNFFKKNAEIASLTKIMTFYTVHQICKKFEVIPSTNTIVIDQQAERTTGTSAEVCEGDEYTVKQLLYGLMLPSGNDAAIALAKWGGSQLGEGDPLNNFINFLNKCAKGVGMVNSVFMNPHGLPSSKSSSNPEEVALLIAQCLKIQLFKSIINTQIYSCSIFNAGRKREVRWQNTNKLLRRPGFTGVKTGVTVTAGPCLASCYTSNESTFIIVLLRTNKLSRRFKETRIILAQALKRYNEQYYNDEIKIILKNNKSLDSDGSEDEQQFNYDRNDAYQMQKRNKILTYQM